MEEYLVKDLTLTQVRDFLNNEEDFKKESGKEFTTNDIWQYVRLTHIPHYLGGNKIESSDLKIKGIKLYNIFNSKEE